MAFDYARLTEITTISDSAAAVCTNPSGTVSYIRQVFLHNTHTAAITVNLYVVPDNAGSVGTAADANQIYEQSIASNETQIIDFGVPGITLRDENETLQAVAGTASKVTIIVEGGTE